MLVSKNTIEGASEQKKVVYFPILAYGCRLKLETILTLTIKTEVLHNIVRLNGEPEPLLEVEAVEKEFEQLINCKWKYRS